MFSLFKKFKEGLAKTVSAISSKTHGIFGGRAIDASSLASLEEALFAADFGVETTAEILRVAIFEMVFRPDIPPVVSINEAIDLSKEFSNSDAKRFINGILDRLKDSLGRDARKVT